MTRDPDCNVSAPHRAEIARTLDDDAARAATVRQIVKARKMFGRRARTVPVEHAYAGTAGSGQRRESFSFFPSNGARW